MNYVWRVLLSIDEYVFGVAAVDKDGNESLVTPYVQTPHPARPQRVEIAMVSKPGF